MNSFRFFAAIFLLASLSVAPAVHAQLSTRLEETHSSVIYQNPGDWRTVMSPLASGGSVAHSNVTGARITIRFNGANIFLQGFSCACGGIARIWLDGQWYDTVDSYAPTTERLNLYNFQNLADGEHVVIIEVLGQRNSASSNSHVIFDSYSYQHGALIEEHDSAVTYTGSWMEVRDPSVSGGSVRASREAGATVRVRFTGTGISWIGYRCPCTAGIARISAPAGGISPLRHTYSPSREPQAEIHRIEGLPQGEYSLTITVMGESVADNAWVAVDAFRVLTGSATGGGPEAEPPTVSMSSPARDALVTGNITIAAEAQDNVGVTKVRFFATGPGLTSPLLLGEDTTAPFSITRDTSSIPSGRTFSLWAQAIDAAGNVAQSGSTFATVQHADRTRPTVSITSPAPNTTLSGAIEITATPDDDMGIARVDFYRDSCCWNALGQTSSAPHVITVDTRNWVDGPHDLSAIATDTAGNASLVPASAVPVVVDNSVQPGMRRIDEEHADIVFSGNWGRVENVTDGGRSPFFHWGDAAVSETAGASVTVTFEGTGIRWLGAFCDQCGDASVSLDGGPAQAVSMGASREFGRPGNRTTAIYTSPTLPLGVHRLTITVLNEHPPGADSVYVDGFEILRN